MSITVPGSGPTFYTSGTGAPNFHLDVIAHNLEAPKNAFSLYFLNTTCKWEKNCTCFFFI